MLVITSYQMLKTKVSGRLTTAIEAISSNSSKQLHKKAERAERKIWFATEQEVLKNISGGFPRDSLGFPWDFLKISLRFPRYFLSPS